VKEMEEKEQMDLEKEMNEDVRKSRETEVETFTKNLAKAKEAYEYQKEQMKVDSEMRKLQMEGENQELIKPVYKYHENPKFWELHREKLRFQDIMENKMDESKIEQMEKQIEVLEEQLKNATEKLAELDEE